MTLVRLFLDENSVPRAGTPAAPVSTFTPAVHKRTGVVDPNVPVKSGAGLSIRGALRARPRLGVARG